VSVLTRFVLVTGMTGAGRGTAAKGLEKLGYAVEPEAFFDTMTIEVGRLQGVILKAAVAGGVNLRKVGETRIGLHAGPAIVGNVGSMRRINYTIVGDTVNAAQRIEQMGHSLIGDEDVTVLFSAATERQLGPEIEREPVGTFTLRGLVEPVLLFRLTLPERSASPEPHAAAQ